MRFENVICSGKLLELGLDGRMGFSDKDISFNGHIELSPEAIEGNRILRLVPGAGRIAGWLRTGFRVTGKTERPRLKISFADGLRDILGFKIRCEGEH